MPNYYLKAFSLLELLLATTILACLIVLAVPAYRGLIKHNRAQIYLDELVATLEFARAYATTTGASVRVCGSNNHQDCSNSWSDSIIVTATNSSKILKILAPPTTKDQLSWHGAAHITFTPNGLAHGYQGSFYYCRDRATNATVIILSPTGQVRISDQTYDGKKIPCID